jgi:hypothetical protein
MTTTTFQDNAELLVDRVVQAMTASRRDIAVKLCLDALQGHRPVTSEQLADALKAPVDDDIIKRTWELAGTLFHGEPARWRNLVGQLIKVCHPARAYEVMLHVRNVEPEAARASIRIAITRGEKAPGAKVSNTELMADCEFYGISTIGLKRGELEERLRKAKAGSGFVKPTCGGMGAELEE